MACIWDDDHEHKKGNSIFVLADESTFEHYATRRGQAKT